MYKYLNYKNYINFSFNFKYFFLYFKYLLLFICNKFPPPVSNGPDSGPGNFSGAPGSDNVEDESVPVLMRDCSLFFILSFSVISSMRPCFSSDLIFS